MEEFFKILFVACALGDLAERIEDLIKRIKRKEC